MKYSPAEKFEIIRLVEQSELGVRRTLEQIGISKSSFYEWYRRYLEDGYDGLSLKSKHPNQFWNRIPDPERKKVVDYALDHTWLSCREVAVEITDKHGYFILRIQRLPHTQGRTALMYASKYGHLDIVSLLISAGADLTARDEAGTTESPRESQREFCLSQNALQDKFTVFYIRMGSGRTQLKRSPGFAGRIKGCRGPHRFRN